MATLTLADLAVDFEALGVAAGDIEPEERIVCQNDDGSWQLDMPGADQAAVEAALPAARAVYLAAERGRAEARIDAAAETARQHWSTPGAGQSAEYAQTEGEAKAAVAAADPLDGAGYPMLAAEQRALAAVGEVQTLRQVAEAVVAIAAAWRTTLAAVKEIRRLAKLRCELATTPAQAAAVAAAAEGGFAALTAIPDGPGAAAGYAAVIAAITWPAA